MPLVRDSPVAGTPNGASIYSATAPTRLCRFLHALEFATEEVLAAMPDTVQPRRGRGKPGEQSNHAVGSDGEHDGVGRDGVEDEGDGLGFGVAAGQGDGS